MRHFYRTAVVVPTILAAACALQGPGDGGPWSAPTPLIGASGAALGTVGVGEISGSAGFRIDASGLPAGVHGIHVHGGGRCDTPKFESAGPHWNPASRRHGLHNPQGPHAGDLPNVTVGDDGRLATKVTAPGPSLAALLDADGAALVIHADPDDYMTDPSGNSGARIACAVLGR